MQNCDWYVLRFGYTRKECGFFVIVSIITGNICTITSRKYLLIRNKFRKHPLPVGVNGHHAVTYPAGLIGTIIQFLIDIYKFADFDEFLTKFSLFDSVCVIKWRRERDSNSRGLRQWFSRPPPYRAWLSRLRTRNNVLIY